MPRINTHKLYLRMAREIAECSYAERLKVGAIIVRDGRIIATGYNGMPAGMENTCEIRIDEDRLGKYHLKTRPEVVHAELNAILFAARNGVSTEGAALYITIAPCVPCAVAIMQAGIKEIYYCDVYDAACGNETDKLFTDNNIPVNHIILEDE